MTPFPLDGGRVGDGGEQPPPSEHHAVGAIGRARRLRRSSTLAERLLWQELRRLQLNFRRQAPIGRYIVDFAQHRRRLIVEIDGPMHDAPGALIRDAHRQLWLEGEGYRVIRFRDLQVINDLTEVVQRIDAAAATPPSPTLPPSRGKGAR